MPLPRGFDRSRSSRRRRTSWEIGPQTGVDGASIAIGQSEARLAAGGVTIVSDGNTLVRLRGSLNVFLTSVDALGNGYHGAFGIGIVTDQAFDGGVSTVPTPITEEDWDGWLYHRYFGLFSAGPIAAATAAQEALQVNSRPVAVHIEVDSKAMRKVRENDAVYAAIEVIELGTGTMEWSFNSRTLFKLP